jgi:pyridoxal phosphate enzyme (YggS family)
MKNTKIIENLKTVTASIREAEASAHRKENSVKLVAVSKFHPAQAVQDACAAGQILFGENRVQEASAKFDEVRKIFPSATLHIIGTLQRNKVREAVKICSCIESVDRVEVLAEIEKQCAKIDKQIEILFEYHTGEASKSGFPTFEKLQEAVRYCADSRAPHVIPRGFMTMAPFTDDEKTIRQSFSSMRETALKLRNEFPQFSMEELSMGMSGDFRIAIEEGSTLVRIGTAIFGPREVRDENSVK